MSKDVIIVGAGPSALTAAIYLSREDVDTTLYERGVVGGMAAITDQIDNYPGFAEGVTGMKLASELQQQAERFGAKIEYGDVTELKQVDGELELTIDGQSVRAKSVLLATGSNYRKLGVPGEDELYGRGVHYCATCDGAFYRDKNLIVVGGGNSAVQEAIFLTRYASHIDLLVRSKLRASDILQKICRSMSMMEKLPFTSVQRLMKLLSRTISFTALNRPKTASRKNLPLTDCLCLLG